MKKIVLLLLVTALSLMASTDIEQAYAKEFAFLKAQKNMLQKRLIQVKSTNKKRIKLAKEDIEALQADVLAKETKSQMLSDTLFKSQQNLESINDDTSLIEAVVAQGTSTLKPYKMNVNVQKENYPATLKEIFSKTLSLTEKLSSLKVSDGDFYLKDGSLKKAKIIQVGNIATYGISNTVSGALVPAGDNKFKIWGDPLSTATAKELLSGTTPKTLHIFIYENANKEVADQEKKTVLSVIDSAGIIGWVIVVLGLVGILFLVLRVFFLISNSGSGKLPNQTLQNLINNGVKNTLTYLKPKKGSTARTLKATVRNIDRDREHIEDIISEAIIHESTRLDKLSSVILIIAAVAPLLGLLGTVTGMIATFDIITEFGTGDPKLLSGGISIALVTTELGLIVAIPLLLAGNLLNSWAENIKDSMEHSALHIVNEYNKQK